MVRADFLRLSHPVMLTDCFGLDNPINQTILSTFMKKKRIKYDVAKNGQEAVQKWRTGGFHLILVSRLRFCYSGGGLTERCNTDGHSDARDGRYPGDERNTTC